MAVEINKTLSGDLADALSIEMVSSFTNEYTRLAQLLGALTVETRPAGAAINQYRVKGKLNDTGAGDNYTEGDTVALSKFTLEKVPLGELSIKPYRKATSAAAILKAGVEKAIIDTDRKMVATLRAKTLSSFFAALGNGTGTATGAGLQACFAMTDAALLDKLEENNDASDGILHFVSRQDVAEYLASAEVTTQNVYGLTYLANFMGVSHVFVTNKVKKGEIYATPRENIKVYGIDLAALSTAGLPYMADEHGLIGVAHTPQHDAVSVETHAILGAMFVPEVQDYIYKGTITAPAAKQK